MPKRVVLSDRLLFLGKVRDALTPALRRDNREPVQVFVGRPCEAQNCPLRQTGAKEGMKECRWLTPQLLVQVEFTGWTAGKHLRHVRFAGIRDEENAREVTKEKDSVSYRLARAG